MLKCDEDEEHMEVFFICWYSFQITMEPKASLYYYIILDLSHRYHLSGIKSSTTVVIDLVDPFG